MRHNTLRFAAIIAATLLGCGGAVDSGTGTEPSPEPLLYCQHELDVGLVTATSYDLETVTFGVAEQQIEADITLRGTVESAKARFVHGGREVITTLWPSGPNLVVYVDQRIAADGGCTP